MSDKVELSTFPSTKSSALALLYVQSRDLTGMTPEDILVEYEKAFDQILKKSKEIREQKRNGKWGW